MSAIGFQKFYSHLEKFATGSLQEFDQTKLQELSAAFFSSLLVDRADASPNNYMFSRTESITFGYRNLCLAQLKVMAHLRHLDVELIQYKAQIEAEERQSQPAYAAATTAEEAQKEQITKAQCNQSAIYLNETAIHTKITALTALSQDIASQAKLIKKMLKTLSLEQPKGRLIDIISDSLSL